MDIAQLPLNEKERLNVLKSYDVLDTPPEEAYDELTELASSICGTPISLISLIDSQRQWFKSKVGLDATETSRDIAFCAHAILQEEVFVVEDALKDQRFADNPLVSSDPHIRFYAGMPLKGRGGEMIGTLCVIDRVPRNLTDDQLKSLAVLGKQVINQFELRLLINRLQEAAEDMKELNATKDKFLSIISHDLKTPFQGILGLSELLLEDHSSQALEETESMLQDLASAAEAGLGLVDNLLKWAQCETGKMAFAPIELELHALVEDVISLLSGAAANKSLRLGVSGPKDLRVHADRNMIFSTVQNLISNAIKFTPEGGEIHVALAMDGPMVALKVSDTGVGMSPEKLNQLFTVEHSISTPGTAGETGTGLGLLLCKQFADRNSGALTVSSKEGVGTSFHLKLSPAAGD